MRMWFTMFRESVPIMVATYEAFNIAFALQERWII